MENSRWQKTAPQFVHNLSTSKMDHTLSHKILSQKRVSSLLLSAPLDMVPACCAKLTRQNKQPDHQLGAALRDPDHTETLSAQPDVL